MATGPKPLADRVHRRPGLRERKKLKAMQHIQRVALDLFDEHGYGVVTIERIATEAEVSASSIYRYFGTKEQLVLYDEYDPAFLAALDDELSTHEPIEAIQRSIALALHELLPGDEDIIRRRMRYVIGEPAVRAHLTAQLDEIDAVIREILARRIDGSPRDLRIRVASSAVLWGFMAMLEYWHETDYRDSLETLLEETVAVISSGLKLT